MPIVDVYNFNKEIVGKLEISDLLFNGEVKTGLLKNCIEYQLAKKRSGNAHTKTKGEISGGGKKPWKQKGTGRARSGSSRSPIWRGGGTIFGPRKRDYEFKLNKKERRAALLSSINYKLKNNRLIVFDTLALESIKTKLFADILQKFDVTNAAVVDLGNDNLKLSSRNIPNIKYIEEIGINVFDLLKHEYLIMSKDTIKKVEERLS